MLTEKRDVPYDFEEIYVSYFSRMKYFAREYVLSDEEAENIVQDVFAELWEKKVLLTYDINLIAFLFTSIKNRCIDYLRHKVVVQDAVNQMQEEYRITLRIKLSSLELFDESMFSEQDIEKIVTDIINSLPEKCREIFIKSKIEGKKQKEIAAELNITLKTIENQMNIAYKKLRSELKDYLPLLLFLLNI
ncbi:MAG: RNA polymerase sigma-70 factor [Tannerella sp.]|jgi:RNA polymerase sigma-70 factor (ECF subfamily)|nr:RNA polymerase sigma-70 factor [Tannerella sp.]